MLEFNATLLFLAVSFILFMLIMSRIFYGPITKVREERKAYIDNQKAMAEENLLNKESLAKEHEHKINEARIKATEILSDANDKAQKQRTVVLNSTKAQINSKIEENKTQVEEEKQNVTAQLKNEAVSLAQVISSTILKEEVSISNVSSELLDIDFKG